MGRPHARGDGRQDTDRLPGPVRRNRLERDRIVTADAVRAAHRLGIRVVAVDGTQDADTVADVVADHFAPYLPVRPGT